MSAVPLRCRGWRQEALLRLLENVLEVGENAKELVVYAALGKAARNWPSHDRIVETLKTMDEDETLIIQSGKPIGLLKTHSRAPLVIMANCNLVGRWATPERFYELEQKGLICWGGLTAGAWQYIGSQGVIQGTYEILMRIAERHFDGSMAGRFVLTAGLGGMGGAQPLAGKMAGAAILCIEVDAARLHRRLASGFLERQADTLDEALTLIQGAVAREEALSVGLCANAADVFEAILARGINPDVVTDQTSAHDLIYGYIPSGRSPAEAVMMRTTAPDELARESRASIVRQVKAMLGFKSAGAVVFDNGNLIRSQAAEGGLDQAMTIPIFTEAYLRPLFCQAIGPYRWIALSGEPNDIAVVDSYLLEAFSDNKIVTNWIKLASQYVPIEGLPARIAWLGHNERTKLALAVNDMVAQGRLAGPVAFTRDHLDAGAMTHPNIMTEHMKDGSDGIADWPLINAMVMCASEADLVAIHSGGGGYAGYMTSAGVTVIADGTDAAAERLQLAQTNDTTLGIMRYADAGYDEAIAAAEKAALSHYRLDARRIDHPMNALSAT